jgi:Flp pilus assembly protein TadB
MSPEMRIGDREREAAASALGEHFAAGRITREEYDERSAVVWAARTNSDLMPVFADLPPLRPSAPGVPRTAPVRQEPGRAGLCAGRRGFGGFRFPLVPVLLLVLMVALVAELFWPIVVLLGVLWWAGVFRWVHRRSVHHSWH